MFDLRNRHFAAQDTLLDLVGGDQDWLLSLQASRAALTLLKNEAFGNTTQSVLPITQPGARIFVTGPTADSLPSLTGGWSVHWQGPLSNEEVPQGISILQG